MILTALRVVAGLLLVCLVPGYLLSRLILGRMERIERMLFSFGLSVVIVVILGFSLTLASILFHVKGINTYSVYGCLGALSVLFSMLLLRKWSA